MPKSKATKQRNAALRATKPKRKAPKPNRRNGGGPSSSMSIARPIAQTRERASYFNIESFSSSSFKDSIRIRGQDFLSPIDGGISGGTPGTNLYNLLINPFTAELGATRLARFAALYDKFLFKNIRFHYEPACPTTTAGGIIVAYDRDPSDTTPSADVHGLQSYFGMQGARTGPPWAPITVECPLTDLQHFYYGNVKGGDERLYAQGQIYVAATTTVPNADLGVLWIEYDVIFFDPQLEDPDTAIRAEVQNVNQTLTAKQAFNGVVAVESIGSAFSVKTDVDGNSYWDFPNQGVYELISQWASTGTSTSLSIAPYVNGVLTTAIASSIINGSGTSGSKVTYLDVPRLGAQIYGTWTSAWTGSAGDLTQFVANCSPETIAAFFP